MRKNIDTTLKNQGMWDVRTYHPTNFAALPGVKSAAWYKLVSDTKSQSPTLSILKALKTIADNTNIITNTSMKVMDVPNFMGMMTLGSNFIYVETPVSNNYHVWWKTASDATFGMDTNLVHLDILCYVEIDASDLSKMKVNMFGAMLQGGMPGGYFRGFYDGTINTTYDIDMEMNGPGTYQFKQSYTSNNYIYLVSTGVSQNNQTGNLVTNYNIAYGDNTVGGIVDIGGWDNPTNYQINREAYDSTGSIIYKGWGNEAPPTWAFGWATNGYNLRDMSFGQAPQKFYVIRKGYEVTSMTNTNNMQVREIHYGNTNYVYIQTNNWWSGYNGNHTNYNEISWSTNGVTWYTIADENTINKLSYGWGVYFINNSNNISTGDSTYFWSSAGSGMGWSQSIQTNLLSGPQWAEVPEYWNPSYTNSNYITVYFIASTNVWSNIQVYDKEFSVPTPETVLGKNFYINNQFPLKYLSLDAEVSNYSVRSMEKESYTYIWTNMMGGITNVSTNNYVEYEWWLSHPMWANQTIFTNMVVWTNYPGSYFESRVETNAYTTIGIWTNYWVFPHEIQELTNSWTNYFTNNFYLVAPVTNIDNWEYGEALRNGNTNNIRLNNLRDEDVYIWYNDGTMDKQSAKFAFSSDMSPKYFKMDSAKEALLNQVGTAINSLQNMVLTDVDINEIWTNENMGNFPGKWAQISNKFLLLN